MGLGFLFVPLTTTAFSTLPAAMRGEGTGLFNLSRNIGSSVGISVMAALVTRNTQINHADIAAYVTPFNPALHAPVVMHALNPLTAAGRAALDGMITLQAVIISYTDDFKLLMILSLAALPLVLLLRNPIGRVEVDHSAVME
jgi:DHA2 family multidrug resistance protein